MGEIKTVANQQTVASVEPQRRTMVVTIDGPAGAGKSSVARALATRLGFSFLDTGAMYRAVALAGIQQGAIDLQDGQVHGERLAEIAQTLQIRFSDSRVFLNDEDVTAAIRTTEVTSATRYAADNMAVRRRLVELQRDIGWQTNTITEGRDQGTVVFPEAQCKIFLTASAEQRAVRRWKQLSSGGESITQAEVLAQQTQRDEQDQTREWGSLTPATDAIEVNTDDLTVEQVVNQLEAMVRQRQENWPSETDNERCR